MTIQRSLLAYSQRKVIFYAESSSNLNICTILEHMTLLCYWARDLFLIVVHVLLPVVR